MYAEKVDEREAGRLHQQCGQQHGVPWALPLEPGHRQPEQRKPEPGVQRKAAAVEPDFERRRVLAEPPLAQKEQPKTCARQVGATLPNNQPALRTHAASLAADRPHGTRAAAFPCLFPGWRSRMRRLMPPMHTVILVNAD